MLMVIFGAGASYDSFPSRRPFAELEVMRRDNPSRPPLANELFSHTDRFRHLLNNYPKCRPLVARLEPRDRRTLSLEEQLEQFESQAATDPERKRQLLSIRYYLRDLIADCDLSWSQTTYGVSNYIGDPVFLDTD